MKEWTCEQCVKKDTDACYYRNVIDGYKYCKDVLVDTDVAYEQGRLDAINECIKVVKKSWTCEILMALEDLKEQI